ncbi:MAG: PAS domain-containing protein, partial [Planctomycetaceae bacterium]|nr:PAS domain-containing protein [Planctomycetaceae bacterium]
IVFARVIRGTDDSRLRRFLQVFLPFLFVSGLSHLTDAASAWIPISPLGETVKWATVALGVFSLLAFFPLIPGLWTSFGVRLLAHPAPGSEERMSSNDSREPDSLSSRQAVRMGTWEVDATEGTIRVSEDFESLFGVRLNGRTRLSIEDWLELIHPHDRLRAARDLEQALVDRQPYDSEFRIVATDGTTLTLLGQGEQRICSSRRGHQVLCGIHLDVTHRRQLEAAMSLQVDDEKRRISEELHDGLGQQLTGIGFLAKGLSRVLEEEHSPHAFAARELSDSIPDMVRELRGLVRGLMPVELDAIGLSAALQQLADRTWQRHHLNCRFETAGNVEIEEEIVAQQFFRIAEEAVNNAIKHSQATEIVIELQAIGNGIFLEIIDNGTGFREDGGAFPGMGTRIMRHRASQIGAALTISGQSSPGTRVRCSWQCQGNDGRSSWTAMENLAGG